MGKKGTQLFDLVTTLTESLPEEKHKSDDCFQVEGIVESGSCLDGEVQVQVRGNKTAVGNDKGCEQGFASELLALLERRGVEPEQMTIEDLRAIAMDYLMEVASMDCATDNLGDQTSDYNSTH